MWWGDGATGGGPAASMGPPGGEETETVGEVGWIGSPGIVWPSVSNTGEMSSGNLVNNKSNL